MQLDFPHVFQRNGAGTGLAWTRIRQGIQHVMVTQDKEFQIDIKTKAIVYKNDTVLWHVYDSGTSHD